MPARQIKQTTLGILFSLIFIAFYTPARGQTGDVSDMLDDGNISNSRMAIKFNLLTFNVGDFPVHVEYAVTDRFSLEGGVGLIAPFYLLEVPDNARDNPEGYSFGSGYSFRFSTRYYFRPSALEYNSIGPNIRYRSRMIGQEDSEESGKMNTLELTGNYAINLIFAKRMVLEVNAGMGLRFRRYFWENEPVTYLNGITPIIQYNARLGFLL